MRSATQSVQLFATPDLFSDWHPHRSATLNRQLASRLSNVQVGAGILLVLGCFPWTSPAKVFTQGGVLPQLVGVVFVILLALYIWQSIRWASAAGANADNGEAAEAEKASGFGTLIKLIGSIAIIVVSAQILIQL